MDLAANDGLVVKIPQGRSDIRAAIKRGNRKGYGRKSDICERTGKDMFSERAAKALAGSRRTKSAHITAFGCRHCLRWHIGKAQDETRESKWFPGLGRVTIKHFKGD